VSPLAVELLDYLRVPRTSADVGGRFPRIARHSLRRALRQLTRFGLVSDGSRAHPLDAWQNWAPIASAFHFATKDPVILAGEEGQRFEELVENQPAASRSRRSRSRARALPAPEPNDPFSDVVRQRRTWRVFGSAPLALEDLAEVLHLSFAVQRWARTVAGAAVALTTSPSAGSRQPLTAYVAARKVRGLDAGLYRYDGARHVLDPVKRGMTMRRLDRYLGHNWWFADAAAAVFITGRVGQVTGRYDHPRAYRFLLLEAGHVCQTFCLACTWRRLAPFCTAALADSMIERDLGVDGFDEILLYAAGVGTRPREGYRQWPDHEPGKPYVEPKAGKRRTR
jgi:SagB-type dehydrogenase family enzyme